MTNEQSFNATMAGIGPHKTWEQAHEEALRVVAAQARRIEELEAENERLRSQLSSYQEEFPVRWDGQP